MTPSPDIPAPDSTAVPTTPSTHQRKPRTIAPAGKLFHPKSGGGVVTKTLYTRVMLDGERVNFALGSDRRQAVRLDRELRARLVAGQPVPAVKAYVAEQLGLAAPAPIAPTVAVADSAGRPWATVRDVFKVRSSYKFTAKQTTTRRYEFCLLNLIEQALQYRRDPQATPPNRTGKRVKLADYRHILDLPASVLTDELVDEFQQSRLVHAERENRDKKAARISANTELRQARAVFTMRARIACRRAKLHLPDLQQFLEAPMLDKAKRALIAPHEDVITGLFEGLRALHAGDPAVCLVLLLALHAGLRRGEILHSHKRWLQTTSGPSLVLRFGAGFEAKNGEERQIPIPRWLYDMLLPLGREYFIGDDASVRKAVLDRAVAWLRRHGFAETGKPLHALRGLCAGYLLTRFPMLVVRRRLGHKDIRTTLDYYSDNPFCDEIAKLWESDPLTPSSGAAA